MHDQSEGKLKKLKLSITYYGRVLKLMSQAGKYQIVLIALFALIFSITPSISTLIMQEIINTLQISSTDLTCILKLLAVYITIDILTGLTSLGSSYFENRFQMKASHVINMSILEKVEELSLKDFENSETYDLLQRAMKVGISRMYAFFKSVILIFQALINVILFSAILFSWKKWLVLLVLLVPTINTVITARYGKMRYEIIKNRSEQERKQWYYQFLLTRDTAAKEIKLFKLGNHIRNKYREQSLNFIKQDEEFLNKKSKSNLLLLVLDHSVNTFIFAYIIINTFAGKLLIGQLTTYIRSVSNVKSHAQSAFTHINSIYENALYISQYFEFIDKRVGQSSFSTLSQSNNTSSSRNQVIPSIKIENLSYKYSEEARYALHNLNLTIEPGQLVAFIGMNGSGKTTLVKLLATLYQDYQGQIFFGDQELKSCDLNIVREKIGILFQDFVRYQLSARENIGFGCLEKMDQDSDIWTAIKKTGMDRRITELSTQLGSWFEQGEQLSGGEWLKLALGRAFIRNADLYLLDEPNAALDPVSEKLILNSFRTLTKGKIGIIISHRITSIKDYVDRIVVFNGGSIEAIGSHSELLNTSKTYREMYTSETAAHMDGM